MTTSLTGHELLSALEHLTGHTETLREASREAKAAAAAAAAEKQDVSAQLQELQDAYKELQTQHGELSVSDSVTAFTCMHARAPKSARRGCNCISNNRCRAVCLHREGQPGVGRYGMGWMGSVPVVAAGGASVGSLVDEDDVWHVAEKCNGNDSVALEATTNTC